MHIAVMGGGQLARMLALAGIPMGISFSFLTDGPESETSSVDRLGTIVPLEPGLSAGEIYQRLGRPDVITAEKEQVDLDLVEALSAFCPVRPNARAFAVCSHRLREKQFLEQTGIPCASYVHLKDASDAKTLSGLKYPLFAKSTQLAYDGKNQFRLESDADLESFASGKKAGDWVVEQGIAFDAEVSVIAVRSVSGSIKVYPINENIHQGGILIYSLNPAPILTESLKSKLTSYAEKVLTALDYVGVLAIECFIKNDEIFVNEMAPRVHNSGHWTQNGAPVSQFENQIRAVADLPLGDTESMCYSGMINLLGTSEPPQRLLSKNASLHWYDKSPRPGRKLGHVNFWADSLPDLIAEMAAFANRADIQLPGLERYQS